MFKPTLILVAVTIAVVPCHSDDNEDNEDARSTCVRNLNTSLRYLSRYYLDEDMLENVPQYDERVLEALNESIKQMEDIRFKVYRALFKDFKHSVLIHGGLHLHCTKEIANDVKRIVTEFMSKILQFNKETVGSS